MSIPTQPPSPLPSQQPPTPNPLLTALHSKLSTFLTPNLQISTADFMQFKLTNLFENVNFQQQAKDQNGNLHPQYIEPIRKGFTAMDDYVELYSNDILNTVREIDLLCIKTADRNYEKYDKCREVMNQQIHKKIFVPFVNSSLLLYKVSNQCLLKGNSIDICANMITDHTYFMFKLAAQRIKVMTYPLQKEIPAYLQPSRIQNWKLNNALD